MKPLTLSIIFGIAGLLFLLIILKWVFYLQISLLASLISGILVTLLLILNHYHSDFLRKK